MSDSESEEKDNTLRDSVLKIVFVGESNVGKTSIIRRLCFEEFQRQYTATVGADFYIKRIILPGKQEVTLKLTDVGGLELRGSMLDKYLFNTDLVVLVYDITNPASFDYMSEWISAAARTTSSPNFSAIFGNKCDLEHQRAVRLDKTNQFINEHDLASYLMSAKTGESVYGSIMELVARHLGIKLTKAQREQQQNVLKVELVPSRQELVKRRVYVHQTKSSVFIEKYTENIRFCIICNYLSKIIPALQSRCTRFRFGPLTHEQILPRLNFVIDEEKLKVSDDGKKALMTLANGDMRKVLNILQSTWLAYKDVTEDNVYTCVGHPLKTDIENIVKWLLQENFKTTYSNIKELKTIKGLALHDILSEIHRYIYKIEFPSEILAKLLDRLAEIEFRLTSGTNENIQLTSLISAFQYSRDIVPMDD